MIRVKRGIQWDRLQIRVPRRGVVSTEKKGLKMIGTTTIRLRI